jgi:hypothetical protein
MYEAVPMAKVTVNVLIWLARVCAWSFAVATVIGVAGAMVLCVVRPDSTHRIMGMSVGGIVKNSWALTYAGWRGALLALGEVVAVIAGLGTSIARKTPYRHIGHLILVLWAALWTVNAFRVFPDGEFNLIYWVPFCLLCTCIRAAANLGQVYSGVPR